MKVRCSFCARAAEAFARDLWPVEAVFFPLELLELEEVVFFLWLELVVPEESVVANAGHPAACNSKLKARKRARKRPKELTVESV